MKKPTVRKPSPATGPATAAPPARLMTLPPLLRAQRLADVLLRNAAPVIGVSFLHYDAHRMLMLYLFDTWIGLVLIAALQALLMQRSSNNGAGNGRSVIANYFDALGSSLLVISLIMVPVLSPALLVVTHEEGRALLQADSTLWPLVAANASAAVLSFVVQSVTMPTRPDTEGHLKHRFLLGFFRWLSVVALFYIVGGFLDFEGGGQILVVLSVLLYSGFSIYAEFYPDHIQRIPDTLDGRNRRSRLPSD